MDIKINMFTTVELSQMLDIRKQMDELQARYDTIIKTAEARIVGTAPATVPGASMPPAHPVPKPEVKPTAVEPTPAAPKPVPAEPTPSAPSHAVTPASKPELKAESKPSVTAHAAVPAEKPAAVEAKSAETVTEPKPTTVSKAPKPDAGPDEEKKDGDLRDCLIGVLKQAAAPMEFEAIFKKLEERGAPLSMEKPKLLLRRMLFDRNTFDVVKGKYTAK